MSDESDLREALEDMVWQFGFKGSKGRSPILYTGGLSALEGAFEALGWNDPHRVSIEALCEVKGCSEWATCGTVWGDLYLLLCGDHYSQAEKATPRPPIRAHAIKREKRRGPDGVLREGEWE